MGNPNDISFDLSILKKGQGIFFKITSNQASITTIETTYNFFSMSASEPNDLRWQGWRILMNIWFGVPTNIPRCHARSQCVTLLQKIGWCLLACCRTIVYSLTNQDISFLFFHFYVRLTPFSLLWCLNLHSGINWSKGVQKVWNLFFCQHCKCIDCQKHFWGVIGNKICMLTSFLHKYFLNSNRE